ncbi:MAG: hypothetical protein QM528_00255 [Phycisphaerales bacterium]|nr:hypothetical protein [Phycisphaerales bacterium]
MKIKSARLFRNWYKTEVKKLKDSDQSYNENFVGTYYEERGEHIKGFFEMYHGDKPNIASYLPSILKIAEDGQAIYEFLQNAVDCGSTHFYIFYNEEYFLALNNGVPFTQDGLRSILNIAQSTKINSDTIGRFGIGFKLAHRLVGKNEGTDELVGQFQGPILFSWSKFEDLDALMKGEKIEHADRLENVNNDIPYLLKILITNFPTDPNETVKDIDYNDKILFQQDELNNLISYLHENFNKHANSLNKDFLNQGSLFFIKLGEGKKQLLDKDYSELINGIRYSMNTLKRLETVYVNDEVLHKISLQLEEGSIKKESEEFKRIVPEYKEFDIKFAIGFKTVEFGKEAAYTQICELKSRPNFYKYFPMGDETNGFGFIVHCDSFSNEANRRKLQKDAVNKNLFPEIAKYIAQKLVEYQTTNRNHFLNMYVALLLSDIPNKENNNWLRPIFYDEILQSLKINIPTQNGCIANNINNVKIKKTKLNLNLSDFNLGHIQWFAWNKDADKILTDEAAKEDKLGIKEWDIGHIVENAAIEDINKWIASCNDEVYNDFLKELEYCHLRKETKEKICKIKLFKFSNGDFFSFNEVVSKNNYGSFNFNYSNCFFINKKTIKIRAELLKLGFVISNIPIENHRNIFSLIQFPEDKKYYELIAEKCKNNNLSEFEKKNLFLNLIGEQTKFDNVGESILGNLSLFCDSNSLVKPLNNLIGNVKTYSWLNAYKIKQNEYFSELENYLVIKSVDIFSKIYQLKQDEIIPQLTTSEKIQELIAFYKDNKKFFFQEFIIKKKNGFFVIDRKLTDNYQVQSGDGKVRNFIDKNCTQNLFVIPYEFVENCKDDEGIIKGNDLYKFILKYVNNIDDYKEILVDILKYDAKNIFLQEISEININSERNYCKEDYEFKILNLACNELKESDYQNFKEKIFIQTNRGRTKISKIPPSADNIKVGDCELSLATILPENYENTGLLSRLMNQFESLGLNKEKLRKILGVTQEPDLQAVFKIFSEKYQLLVNSEQLAFLFLYGLHIEKINFNQFKALNVKEEEVDLGTDKYLTDFDFVQQSEILHHKYSGITKIFKRFPVKVDDNDNLLLIKKPYFEDDEFVCPYIKNDLSDEGKISLLEFLFDQWDKKNKKTAIKNIDWSKIDDVETVNILGFNPTTSVFPSKYACESEALPDYLIKWIGNAKSKIDFLTDLGIWTENSVIVELRQYLSGEINVFHNNRLAQETHFNEDQTVLFNSFQWLKEKEIKLKTTEQFETFKAVVAVINDNRTNNKDLKIEEASDFEELAEKSTEWEEPYYENWKQESKILIYLYEGALPKSVLLDEIEDCLFYYFYEGNIAIDDKNHIYINKKSDIKKELRKLELEENSDFNFDELWQNKLDILEKEVEQLREKNKATLGIGHPPPISRNDQIEANRVAKEIVKKKLESVGFEFKTGIGKYSTVDGVFKDGVEYPLVIKSYQYQDEPFKISTNEWIQLMKPNACLWVYFGNNVCKCIKLFELLRMQDRITLSFSTENLDRQDRLNKFATLLRYFESVHFEFDKLSTDNNTAQRLSDYRFDDRKTEEDLSADDETQL